MQIGGEREFQAERRASLRRHRLGIVMNSKMIKGWITTSERKSIRIGDDSESDLGIRYCMPS